MTGLRKISGGFELCENGVSLLLHTADSPAFFAGIGQESIEMFRGNFDISDYISQRVPFADCEIAQTEGGAIITLFCAGKAASMQIKVSKNDNRLVIEGHCSDAAINRLWIRVPAAAGEHVYGGGEQFSHLDMSGRRYPIWTSEQGVGRNKSELMTFYADKYDRAGGDYWWTFFPQPTFVSSLGYYLHLTDTCYSALDFRRSDFHELELWQNSFHIVAQICDNMKHAVSALTELLGRQRALPDWAVRGVWLGIQGGTEAVETKLETMLAANTDVSAVWCQDWQGIRMTSFGKRLMWNWAHDEALYPELQSKMKLWKARGIHFMGYINPYVCVEGSLFAEADRLDYLVRNTENENYIVDFGEFYCGIPDFTNPKAFEWYKQVIKTNLIDFGLDGWMADFGEYLPSDCVLFSGESAMTAHNRWPALWARCNYEAVAESGKLGEIVYFMRAGAAGSQKYSTLMWAGDQNVDWSIDDGLASVMTSALSAGFSGCGLHTCDIGGYTTLFHAKRTKQLFMRWAEFAAFTPVMRTHEGNRPADNWQFDSDEETIAHFAWCSKLHTLLSPYIRELMAENEQAGVPVMRAMALEYPDDERCASLQFQYMLGADMLVAPVYTENADSVNVYFPESGWQSLWTGEAFESGEHTVFAPLGAPAVFVKNGRFSEVFSAISRLGRF